MQAYYIVTEEPAGSGTYVPTGEVVATNAQDAVARCIELSGGGGKFGCWVYESIAAAQILPHGGVGAADDTTTRARPRPAAGPKAATNVDVPDVSQTGSVVA